MKRLLFAIIVIVMLVGCAQWGWVQEYIEDQDGHNWVKWTYIEKAQYVRGFYAAHSAMRNRMIFSAMERNEKVSQEQSEWLDEWFYFWLKVDEMVDRVDNYYLSYKNREAHIIDVMYLVANKDYWN
jgi:uncharacterized lipoprotein YehR (DUF1307 family)